MQELNHNPKGDSKICAYVPILVLHPTTVLDLLPLAQLVWHLQHTVRVLSLHSNSNLRDV